MVQKLPAGQRTIIKMSDNKKTQHDKDFLTVMAIMIAGMVWFFGKFLIKGILRKKTWSEEFIYGWILHFMMMLVLAYSPRWNILDIIDFFSPQIFSPKLAPFIYDHISPLWQYLILSFAPFLTTLFVIGLIEGLKLSRMQKAIDHLGIKTSTGLSPTVVKVIELEQNQKKLLIKAVGIDVNELRAKKGALESAFNSNIQEIKHTANNKQLIEINLAHKELPTLVNFEESMSHIKRPYSCLVGQSLNGFVVADFCDIHHMILAGTTGGGKSNFFKQALISLMKSSNHIQLYIVDLKRVEANGFSPLKNVLIAKELANAVALLEVVVSEMEKRFIFLEKQGHTEINPLRDKKDRLFVAIDEASLLFIVEKSSKENHTLTLRARELTDKIAKLGRAAAIHLIIATQKIVKETIDTSVQTNINAKLCFRVNTMASSMTVLGHKKAYELPKIKGRAIWSVGNEDTVIQVPKLDGDELVEEFDALKSKFNAEEQPFFGPMLSITDKVHKRGQGHVVGKIQFATSETNNSFEVL